MPRRRFTIAWLMGLVLFAAMVLALARNLTPWEFALLLCIPFSVAIQALYFYGLFVLIRWLIRAIRRRRARSVDY